MSAKPLTREEREDWEIRAKGDIYPPAGTIQRWFDAFQAAEERAERLREGMIRMSSYDAVAREYLAADDAARGDQ